MWEVPALYIYTFKSEKLSETEIVLLGMVCGIQYNFVRNHLHDALTVSVVPLQV